MQTCDFLEDDECFNPPEFNSRFFLIESKLDGPSINIPVSIEIPYTVEKTRIIKRKIELHLSR
jgi:hypothetical protein